MIFKYITYRVASIRKFNINIIKIYTYSNNHIIARKEVNYMNKSKPNIITVGYSIKINMNKRKIKKAFKIFGACRSAYNIGIDMYEEYRKDAKDNDNYEYKSLSFYSLNNKFTQLKNTEEYNYLKEFDSTTLKIILRDLMTAYNLFFNKIVKHPPKYKRKKHANQSFPVRKERMHIEGTKAYIPGLGTVNIGNVPFKEIFGDGNKDKKNKKFINYLNPRIKYDGKDFYLTFNLEENISEDITTFSCKRYRDNPEWQTKEFSSIVAIDLGCSGDNWIVDSRGVRVSLPNCSKEYGKIANLFKVFDHKCKYNKQRSNGQYSKNQLKVLEKINKNYKHITNKKMNVLYKYLSSLIKTKPEAIVLESIFSNDFIIRDKEVPTLYRKLINSKVLQSMLSKVSEVITQYSERNSIKVIKAPVEYPSTQICSCCGNKYKLGPEKIYSCPVCNNIINRDDNAVINLFNYGEKILHPRQLVSFY